MMNVDSRRLLGAAAVVAALVFTATGPAATAQTDPRTFDQTGYRIDDDAFWQYFQSRGQVSTFGYPVSRAFPFLGCTTQFFQRLVMQRCGPGGVGTLNLLDEGLLPYTSFNGSIVPGPDPAVKDATPRADRPDYGSAVLQFVRATAPDTFDGQPVNFQSTYFSTISADVAGTTDSNILGLLDLEIWGAPTSQPAHDPNNAGFIYQRFQRGIMHFDASCQCTRGLLLADYLKAVITGQNLPGDLGGQAANSPLLNSAVNGSPPDGTDYAGAFIGVSVSSPAVNPPGQPTSTPVGSADQPTATPVVSDTILGRTKEAAPGQVEGALSFTEPRGTERCTSPLPPSGALAFEVRPDVTREYPDVFVTCLDAVANTQDVKVSGNPSGGTATLKQDFAAGAHWPPNGPELPGTYTLTGSQQGASAVTQVVKIQEASSQRVLVYPRRGAPGTSFDVYLGGFPKNQPATLRVYRCDLQPHGGNALACQDADKRVYVTSLAGIAVDGAGRAKVQLTSKDTDPQTEYALLSDDMVARVQQQKIITDETGGVGKAWFCTAPAPTCQTERD